MRDGDQWHYLYQLLFNVVHVEVRLSLCVCESFFDAFYVSFFCVCFLNVS